MEGEDPTCFFFVFFLRSESNRLAFFKHRNYCTDLLQKTKNDKKDMQSLANINVKDVPGNKNFWKTIKPLLFNKIKSSEKMFSWRWKSGY